MSGFKHLGELGEGNLKNYKTSKKQTLRRLQFDFPVVSRKVRLSCPTFLPMSDYSQFETLIPVRPDDIDMNQHVHNSRYYDYVLAARYDQMERCYGMSMKAFVERGFSWFVRSAYIEHKRPLHLSDVAVVNTCIEEIRSRGVKVWFKIRKQSDNKIAAQGWFDYAMVSAATGRPELIPDDIVEKYSI